MPVDIDELSAIVRVLKGAAFFDLSPECTRRRFSTAQWLLKRGFPASGVALLWEYAKKVGDNPHALFAFWLGAPSRADTKFTEMMAKPAWVEATLKRLNEVEVSGDPAPIIDMRQFRRNG